MNYESSIGKDTSFIPVIPFYDTDEFERRATAIIGDPRLVSMLSRAKDRYEFVIGVGADMEIEDFFWDEYDFAAFVHRHSLKIDSADWDYEKLANLLEHELGLDSDAVDSFIECEREYMIEQGIIVIDKNLLN